MNAIRQTALLNKRELENATPPSASWHVDYRDTAWIYVGGLPLDLSEGDVITIFSQFGNPTHVNLIREKDTGKSKGFGFLKYEDQRSCDLAVDNLGGADVLGRLLRVDHTRYKRKEGEDEDTHRIERLEAEAAGENGNGKKASDTEDESQDERRGKKKRRMLKEERELEEMSAITQDGEEADPMREYLIREKREEVERARENETRSHKHKHRQHRERRDEDGEAEGGEQRRRRRNHRHRDRSPEVEDRRKSGKEHREREKIEGRDGRDRRRSKSRDRDDDKLAPRRPRDSRSPSDDHDRRRRKDRSRSRSPRRRPRYADDD